MMSMEAMEERPMGGAEEEEEAAELETQLAERRAEAEVAWLLFVAALRCYRRDFLLKPFPPLCLGPDGVAKDWERLQLLADSMPPIKSLRVRRLSREQRALLSWVLKGAGGRLRLAQEQTEVEEILTQGGVDKTRRPNLCFAFQPSPAAEAEFQAAAGSHPRVFAFHGSSLQNFHSILHHGLISNLNKTSMFGEGTYLSSEMSVALNWARSARLESLGGRFSAIGVAEVALVPGKVIQGQKAEQSGGVPQHYILVRNDALLRLRYLLVYAERGGREGEGATLRFLRRSWPALLLIFYALLLATASLASSHASIQDALRRFSALIAGSSGEHRPPYDET